MLGAAASAGLPLEVNSDGGDIAHAPCPGPAVLRWWREAGGSAVSFGSDAHAPEEILAGFAALRDVVEAAGFRPAPHEFGFWLA